MCSAWTRPATFHFIFNFSFTHTRSIEISEINISFFRWNLTTGVKYWLRLNRDPKDCFIGYFTALKDRSKHRDYQSTQQFTNFMDVVIVITIVNNNISLSLLSLLLYHYYRYSRAHMARKKSLDLECLLSDTELSHKPFFSFLIRGNSSWSLFQGICSFAAYYFTKCEHPTQLTCSGVFIRSLNIFHTLFLVFLLPTFNK